MEFTYNAYANLIRLLKLKNYRIRSYKDYHDYDLPVILRHDIDYSLKDALQFAKLEQSLNVNSTYFVLLSSDFYNVFSKKSLAIISEILSLGHDIGLHFDETKYPATGNDLVDLMKEEACILSRSINYDIKLISMHRPSKKTLDADYKIDGFINSYGKVFIKEFKYLSDSRMRWREDIIGIINSQKYRKLHILTHAFWYRAKERTLNDIIETYCRCASLERYDNFNVNFTNLSEVLRREDVM